MTAADNKLLTRATLLDGVGLALLYALLTSIVIWVMSKFLISPEALTLPIPLALGLGIGGAIFELFFPTSRIYGVWCSLGEALGNALGLAIVCTAPMSEFFFAFVAIAVCAHIGQYLRVWRLKKRGYTLASE